MSESATTAARPRVSSSLWDEKERGDSPIARQRRESEGGRKVGPQGSNPSPRGNPEVVDLTLDEEETGTLRKRARNGNRVETENSRAQKKKRNSGLGHKQSMGANPPPGSVRSAWLNAAMAWRQKNMPSPSELKKRKADAARRTARESAARKHRARDFQFHAAHGVGQEWPHFHHESQQHQQQQQQQQQQQPLCVPDPSVVRPADSAPLEDWQAYFRAYHGSKIRNATSFVQVLRAFDIPCSDPKKIKVAYMQAVRMYHPDSNSKTRTFTTERDRCEAEEIMKLINQRKPEVF